MGNKLESRQGDSKKDPGLLEAGDDSNVALNNSWAKPEGDRENLVMGFPEDIFKGIPDDI